MAVGTVIAFAATSAVLLAIPGPPILLKLSYALGRGWRAAVAAGFALGELTAMTLSTLGLGFPLALSAELFTTLKWVGAAYPVWLGVKLLRVGAMLPAEPCSEARPRVRMLGAGAAAAFSARPA